MMQGLIIGGGIGGLTTAVAMQQSGMQVRLYEKAAAFNPAGTGIVLAVNAMRILDKMGLSGAVYEKGNELNGLNITNEALLPLSKNNVPYFSKKYGSTHIAIYRPDLQDILHAALQDDILEMDKNCTGIREEGRRVVAEFEDGVSAQGDYLLGMDGLHSVIRKQLFPEAAIRDIKQICWRGVLAFDLPARYRHHAIEAWGKGRRFGFVRISADKVYWFALINKHDNGFDFRNKIKVELGKQFSGFAPLVRQMISGTPEDHIIRSELMDIKPLDQWYFDRVCLMGDAAHAMTPNLGQGACQAIEDAWVMASLMKQTKNPAFAFPEFQKIRKPRADYVGRLSYRIGRMAQYENSLLVGLRNRVMKSIPQTFTRKQYDKIFAPGYE